jgi:hypothetical protein
MRNQLPINHFPPILFSPSGTPIYERRNYFTRERAALIAPCGMNCGLCMAFLRSRNACPGRRGDDSGKPKTRVACRIKTCDRRIRAGAKYCGGCSSFPCELLMRLDKRYRSKYGMSMIENLKAIQASGIRRFVRDEQTKWVCPGCGEM